MNTYRKNAIIAGVLWITATAAPLLSFAFWGFIPDDPDYLVTVSGNESQVIIGVLLELVYGFAVAGIAIWLYPVLRRQNEGAALWSVGFRLIEGMLYIISVIGLLLLLSLSREYLEAGAPDTSFFPNLGTLFMEVRDWVGILGSIAFILGAAIYYYLFYQTKVIPRWLSIWGLVGVPLWIAGALLLLFGRVEPFSTPLIILDIPIAINEMVLAVWLIAKGFNPSAIASLSAKTD